MVIGRKGFPFLGNNTIFAVFLPFGGKEKYL